MTTNGNRHRTWAGISGYYDHNGPPIAAMADDWEGPLLRIEPFGHGALLLVMTESKWREISLAVEKAILDSRSGRLKAVGA